MPIYFERESGTKVHELHVYGTPEELAALGERLKQFAREDRSIQTEPKLDLRYPDVRSGYFAGVTFHSVPPDRLQEVRRRGERKQVIFLAVVVIALGVAITAQLIRG